MTASPVLSLQSYGTPPNSTNRRFMFQQMSRRTRLTLNPPQVFMTNCSLCFPHLSLMTTVSLIPTVVPLLLVNHSHRQYQRSTRERRVIRTHPAPLRISNIPMIAIISITMTATTMIVTMVIITIEWERCLAPIEVQHPVYL